MTERLSKNDPSSYSNPEDCSVIDMDINLEVDFKKHVLSGYVDFTIERTKTNADLVLDTKDLTITAVKNKNTLNKMSYSLGEPSENFGSRLEIKLPKRMAKKFVVRVEYETSPESTALQWLEPLQTAGKKHPYMFSMCQSIHARSMLPCQDTPSVKTPYTATITAPYELVVLMSAVPDGEEMADDPFMKNYKFVQKNPIPSYLIAVVIGALKSKKIGPRSHVWSEAEFVERAAEEFSETEQMLSCAEEMLGEYVWDVYDILVLPPSFAFGGMENPCLTFVTPTLLAGDKSLVPTIAHEIAHSWTGNLVTNKNFEHFWLNEGFTQFFERKILGHLHGKPVRDFENIGGWMDLVYDVKSFGEDHNLTKLVPDLTGVHPDDGCSHVPYEKGQAFLYYLETLLGGEEIFEKFLKAYVQEYKLKSIETDTWKSYLYGYFADRKDILDKVDWEAWLYTPGMPPVKPKYDDSLAKKCQDLSQAWILANDNELEQFTPKDVEGFTSSQIIEFLSFLLLGKPLSVKKLEMMDETYKLGKIMNSEARFRWIRLCLVGHWKDIIPNAVKFITEQGRAKFVCPVYRDMYSWEESREVAISTYKEHSSAMMSTVSKQVAQILHLTPGDS